MSSATLEAAPAVPAPYLRLAGSEPIRAERFGPESMEAYARQLREAGQPGTGRAGPLLCPGSPRTAGCCAGSTPASSRPRAAASR